MITLFDLVIPNKFSHDVMRFLCPWNTPRYAGALPKAKVVVMDRAASLVNDVHNKQLKLQEEHIKLLLHPKCLIITATYLCSI